MEAEHTAAVKVTAWNEAHPIGTPVRYWPGVKTGDGLVSRTRSAAWTLSMSLGEAAAVVLVEDCAGCIWLAHIEVIG